MAWDNKVLWSEGMFLQTQHFQQNDRYIERLVRGASQSLRSYPWGLSELAINRDLLSVGKIGITAAKGVFDDGTPFSVPADVSHPEPIDVGEGVRNCIVYLVLPVRQPGAVEFDLIGAGETVARYRPDEDEVRDVNTGSESVASIRVAKLRIGLALESEERAGFTQIAIARIIEARSDRQVLLDDRFIPPCLDCAASSVLTAFVTELNGLLHHRGEALAGRVSESGTKGAAEISDFLLLQAVNRFEPLIAHMTRVSMLHPETLYATSVGVAGELATFTAKNKRPPQFPPYMHHDLQRTFQPVIASLRQSLSAVLEQSAIPLELQERKYGIRVAPIPDRSLITMASFVLAVRADIPTETLRRDFPSHVKIGPVEQIRQLVTVALVGIAIRPLPVAPRQIPYHAGVTYFELDTSNPLWKQMPTSGGLAMHVSGEFPGLGMEFWAIKG
jgi:type VI secretion system protein ImpJ